MAILLVLLSLVPILLVGNWLLSLLAGYESSRTWQEDVTLSLALGCGFVAYVLFLISQINHHLALNGTIAITLLLALTRLFQIREGFRLAGRTMVWEKEQWHKLLLAAPLILLSFSVIAVSWASDLGFDGLVTWGFKAKLAFSEGGWPSAYFVDPWRQLSHPDYPLLVPSIEAWIYTFLGRVDEQAIKILFILYYLALLTLFYGLLKRRFTFHLSILYTTLLACTPYLASLAAVSGYVDVPLAFFLLGATAYLYRWLAQRENADLWLAAVMSALAIWVKREAIIYGLFNVTAVIVYLLIWQRSKLIRQEILTNLFRFFLPGFILLLPWFIFLAWYQVPNSDFESISVTVAWRNLDRLQIIFGKLIDQYASLGRWGIAWIIWASVSIWRRPFLASPAQLYLWGSAFVPIMGLSALFIFSIFEPFDLHMDLALERLFLHAIPLAWYFVALQTTGLEGWLQQLLRQPRRYKPQV